MDSASFAPALQAGTAVATDMSLLLANTSAHLVVPDGAGTLVFAGKAIGISHIGGQDNNCHHSQEDEKEFDLHHCN